MRAGSLNTRVTVESFTPGDGWSNPGGWQTYTTTWANVRHLSGSESIRSDRPVSEVRASIRVRFRQDLNASMRVLVGGKTYSVEAVMPDLLGKEHTDLVCKLVE